MRKLFFLSMLLWATWVMGNEGQAVLPDSIQERLAAPEGEARVEALLDAARWLASRDSVSQAIAWFDQAAREARRMGAQALYLAALQAKAEALEQHFNFDDALEIWLKLLAQTREGGDRHRKVEALLAIGRLHLKMQNFEEAEKALKEAEALAQQAEDKEGLARVWQGLGALYQEKGVLGQAKHYYRKALDYWIGQRHAENALALSTLIGSLSLQLGDFEGALLHFQMARDLHSQMGDKAGLAADLLHIALAQHGQGFDAEALDAADAALSLKAASPLVQARAWLLKADLATDEARRREWLERARAALEQTPLEREAADLWVALAQKFAAAGAWKEALQAEAMSRKALTAWYDAERNRAMLEMNQRFATETALKEQQQRIQLLEMEQARSQMFRNLMMVIVALLVLAGIILWRAYREKKKDNILLKEKNAQIEEARQAIERKNAELGEMNRQLEELNQRLVREIGERESIEKSSFARDRFLAIMSQEMRTPLNIITNLTHQLMDETPRPDQKERLRQLQFAANNLVVFVNDVLDFSRIEAGKLTLDSRPFPIKKLVREVCEQYQMAGREQGTRLNLVIDKKIPDWLDGDAGRLNQILSNLMALALDRNAGKDVDLALHLHELHPDEAILRVSLTGTDPILESREIEELKKYRNLGELEQMESFSRADLSLFITRRLVDLQNGHIEVEQENGRQVLLLFLPFKLAESDQEAPAGDQHAEGTPSLGHLKGKKVLLAEDNKINQVVVANLLRNLGMEVVTANNGEEAVEAIKRQDFDIVLMDIQMPAMDGYQATLDIRKMEDPRKRDVPIIALTASAFLTEREKARLFGMNDHVGKPFSPEELLDKIARLLKVHYTG